MKQIVLTLLLFISLLSTLAQQQDVFDIRNFNNSLVVADREGSVEQIRFSDYGELISQSNETSNFLYQNQEWEKFLGLYLFESRLYDPKNKRFFQPDPKSQYHSAYLFVGSDPINIIDLNGTTGKPLVLYERQTDEGLPMNEGIEDLKLAAPNAHYVPLDEFLSGKNIDVPEWNGNVFIKAHMSVDEPDVLEIQRVYGKGKININKDFTTQSQFRTSSSQKVRTVEMDSKEFGRKLRQFAKSKKVKVKTIVSGGCEGAETGRQIGIGFIEKSYLRRFKIFRKKFNLKILGVKKDNALIFTGPNNTGPISRLREAIPLRESRVYFRPSDKLHEYVYHEVRGKKYFSTFKVNHDDGREQYLNYIDHEELDDYINGRISRDVASHFEEAHVVY